MYTVLLVSASLKYCTNIKCIIRKDKNMIRFNSPTQICLFLTDKTNIFLLSSMIQSLSPMQFVKDLACLLFQTESHNFETKTNKITIYWSLKTLVRVQTYQATITATLKKVFVMIFQLIIIFGYKRYDF